MKMALNIVSRKKAREVSIQLSKKTNEEEDPSKSNPTIFVTNPIINIMALVDLR
jgi:hypothetical protein